MKKSEGRLIKGWINPLQLIELDKPWSDPANNDVTTEEILNFICTPGEDNSVKDLIGRYKEISQEKKRLSIAPAEERILEKLVWPLRHAKADYMVGNYLGTISLSGMVAEMVAILWFELSEISFNKKILRNNEQKHIFGREFEKLGQQRRVEILHSFNVISDEIKTDFDTIRTLRRKYLHLWSQDHDRIPKDASKSFFSAVSIVVEVIGQDFRNGMVLINPKLVKYLEKKGVYQPEL